MKRPPGDGSGRVITKEIFSMRSLIAGFGLTILAACAVLAQTTPDQLTFEVASVKPARQRAI